MWTFGLIIESFVCVSCCLAGIIPGCFFFSPPKVMARETFLLQAVCKQSGFQLSPGDRCLFLASPGWSWRGDGQKCLLGCPAAPGTGEDRSQSCLGWVGEGRVALLSLGISLREAPLQGVNSPRASGMRTCSKHRRGWSRTFPFSFQGWRRRRSNENLKCTTHVFPRPLRDWLMGGGLVPPAAPRPLTSQSLLQVGVPRRLFTPSAFAR